VKDPGQRPIGFSAGCRERHPGVTFVHRGGGSTEAWQRRFEAELREVEQRVAAHDAWVDERVEFAAPLAAEAYRTGVVVELVPLREALKELARLLGIPWPSFVEEVTLTLVRRGDRLILRVQPETAPGVPVEGEGPALVFPSEYPFTGRG
jgi:hypothetical protein